jgi:hypothetical protein
MLAINHRLRGETDAKNVPMLLALALLAFPAAAQDPAVGAGSPSLVHGVPRRRTQPEHGHRQRAELPAIAARPSTTAGSLDRYLSVGHTLMPDFSLSSQERNALVAYILSLR